MMRNIAACIILLCGFFLTACGFTLPHTVSLKDALPEVNLFGSDHHVYFKLVRDKLLVQGVKVHVQPSNFDADSSDIPSLSISSPSLSLPLTAISSLASSIEQAVIVTTRAQLRIPKHRPITMRNALTRALAYKSGKFLTTDNEAQIVINETYEELASQLMLRLSYLGRQSDPNAPDSYVTTLLNAQGEDESYTTNRSEYSTLFEALAEQDQREQEQAQQISLDELNNGTKLLEQEHYYNLPKVEPRRVHQAPETLSEDGF